MKTINKIINGIKIIAGFSVLYSLGLLGIQGISELTSPKINNQTQLEQMIKTERKLAGIKEEIKIYAKINKNGEGEEGSYALRRCKDNYQIILSPDSRLSGLRHELYHIADGHCDKEYNLFEYFFIQEPQATIYQITRLKP